jgi:DNA-binding CsgD family transcriptional regulator
MTIRVLSPVEMRVAQLAVAGLSDLEMARALGVNRDTIVRHVSRICRKLGARSRPELIAILADNSGANSVDRPADTPR